MTRKKKPEPRQYTVPMRWTIHGTSCVEASSPEEAVEKAERRECVSDQYGECVDWEVTGDPTE